MSLFHRGRVDAYCSNDDHLRDELRRVGGLVRAHLLRFKQAYPEQQRERFWHLPDDYLEGQARNHDHAPMESLDPTGEVAGILAWTANLRAEIDRRTDRASADLRLIRLAREYGLTQAEIDGLLLALLPALHSTYRRWFGVLQHDAAKSLATVGLLAEMIATSERELSEALAVLAPSGRLATHRLLLHAGTDDEPATLRSVFVDDRLLAFLMGGDALDMRIDRLAAWFADPVDLRRLPIPVETINRLEMLPHLRAAEPDFHRRLRIAFFGPDAGLAVRAFAGVSEALGRRALAIDAPAAVAVGANWTAVVDSALREARLGIGLPIFTGVASLYEQGEPTARLEYLRHRLETFPHPAAFDLGAPSGEEGRALAGWIPFRLPIPTIPMRERLWAGLLTSSAATIADAEGVARDLSGAFQLTDTQIREAWRAAEGLARRRNVFIASIARDDVYAACRQQSSKRLVAFAQRLEPRGSFTLERDLILPPANKRALYELRARIRNHTRVHGALGLGDHLRQGRGVTALFIGASGTGKTLAAEVLANEQQVDLYRIDLSACVSKWLGETEKNLSRIFADAERANCMLFFDEADAMFGQRGDIREARDRWANLEVNYLLQRIEDYSGVVILATNLRQNIDDAFQRRIHVVVDFPAPNAACRKEIWERILPAAPCCEIAAEDVAEIAERFEMSGGSIRNAVLDASFRAVDSGRDVITARHLIAGIAREHQKVSHPVTRGEFGRFYDWAMTDVIVPTDASPAAGA
jgi:hypothetical protein